MVRVFIRMIMIVIMLKEVRMGSIYKLIIICLLLQSNSAAQSLYIRGKVLDAETGLPLSNASIFINNSTTGTISNATGEFQLGPFAPGSYEVIASFVGFDRLLYAADLQTISLRITFQMTKKDSEMRELLILPEETRMKYLEAFKRNLLGETSAAKRAKIRNLKDVQFAATQDKNEIVAYCDTTIVVDNPELGYVVHFDLVDFYLNRRTGESRFYGYTRFQEKDENGTVKRKWLKRRRDAYEGSSMHFFRSLVACTLKQEGFDMQNVYKKEMKPQPGQPVIIQASPAGINNSFNIAVPVTEDSVLRVYRESGYKIYQLKTADWLRILYNKNTDLKEDIMRSRIIGGQPRTGTVTGLRPFRPPILVDNRGRVLSVMGFYYEGMWSYERLANMLPEDYVPE